MYEWKQDKNGEFSYAEVKKKFKIPTPVISVLVSLLTVVAVIAAVRFFSFTEDSKTRINQTMNGSLAPVVAGDTAGFIGIGEKLAESMVFIPVSSSDDFFASSAVDGSSGVIVKEDGYIITSATAVENSSNIKVYLSDGVGYDAQILGIDSINDCAVLKIDKTGLKPIEFADSDKVQSGETVASVGRILGSQLGTTTILGTATGVSYDVSLTNGQHINLMQTNAATDNSGGSVIVNADGKALGMISSRFQTGIGGIYFVMPSNDIVKFIGSLQDGKAGSSSEQLIIGIRGYDSEYGVIVEYIGEGTPAEKGGLRAEDLIMKADGVSVTTVDELNELRDKHKKGDTMTFSVFRDDEVIEISVVL